MISKGKPKVDVRAEINDRLIEALEAGKVPWRKPWICDENAGTPCNFDSGKDYLDRESRLYALGELYAEITGCYVCGSLGIPNDIDNSATYLASWLEKLKAKPGLIVSVAQWASKGADCILGNEFAKNEFIKHKEIVTAG